MRRPSQLAGYLVGVAGLAAAGVLAATVATTGTAAPETVTVTAPSRDVNGMTFGQLRDTLGTPFAISQAPESRGCFDYTGGPERGTSGMAWLLRVCTQYVTRD